MILSAKCRWEQMLRTMLAVQESRGCDVCVCVCMCSLCVFWYFGMHSVVIFVCVCVCVCIYIYIYTYINDRMFVRIVCIMYDNILHHTCVCLYMYVKFLCFLVSHVCRVYILMHIYVMLNIYIYIYMYIYTYICTYIHIHILIYTIEFRFSAKRHLTFIGRLQ